MQKDNRIKLYHGSQNKEIVLQYGLGDEKHDYGKGFYLTENPDLAAEWSVCNPNEKNGWVHEYELDCSELKILDLQETGILSWLAELMKHRDADKSRRYQVLAPKFIHKYQVVTKGYDVIKGWRANASYFYIAKSFVRDEIDLEILPELLNLGELGIQYCLKSDKAFDNIHERKERVREVSYEVINPEYSKRDSQAREAMYQLINSERNKVEKVFSTLL